MEGIPQQKGENIEDFGDWRERRDNAPKEARSFLVDHELITELESALEEDIERLIKAEEDVMKELEGNNQNRYIARELSLFFEEARQYARLKNLPKAVFRQGSRQAA